MKIINLKGKRALVTGGSVGIGEEICRQLAICGADIFINYYGKKEIAEELAEKLKQEYGVKTACGFADVADSKQVAEIFNSMDNAFGGIDVLINNAGSESILHVLDLDEAEWDRVLNINLKGPFLCSKQAGLRMENHEGGNCIT